MKQKPSRIAGLLDDLETPACCIDRDGVLRHANKEWFAWRGQVGEPVLGQHFTATFESEFHQWIKEPVRRALSGKLVSQTFEEHPSVSSARSVELTLIPAELVCGDVNGAIIVLKENRDTALLSSTKKDMADYLVALNAHAIVAITDRKGVIVQVNEKFCDISQYSRDELYGNTHRVVNSGHHPRRFFTDIWRAISKGEIWQGQICNRAKDGSIYWVFTTIVPFLGDDGKPERYVAIRADITELKKVELYAQQLSRRDVLTGLYNRRVFSEKIFEAQTDPMVSDEYCGLLSIDLDDFKHVNDQFGHVVGDQLLVELSARLVSCVRKSDTVVRMGGDEFLIILPRLGRDENIAVHQATVIGEKVLETIFAPFHLDEETYPSFNRSGVTISGSIGGRAFRGNAESQDDLLTQVDWALYRAKNSGRNRLVFYDEDQHEAVSTLVSMESALRNVLARNELFVQYQPIVDQQKSPLGMEALVRWNSPEHGLVSPVRFIPLAERSGMITSIGRWVLEVACRQLMEWAKSPETSAWTLSVNVSAHQFNSQSFYEDVLQLLGQAGVRPDRLILEVTENVLLNTTGRQIQSGIQKVRELGVGIAIDDFGTGYSSMSYLRNLPVTRIKIDKSFIDDVLTSRKDQGIVMSIMTLAKALDLQVVAEGVETVEQFNYLRDAGCPAFQGYLFGKPGAPPSPTQSRGSQLMRQKIK